MGVVLYWSFTGNYLQRSSYGEKKCLARIRLLEARPPVANFGEVAMKKREEGEIRVVVWWSLELIFHISDSNGGKQQQRRKKKEIRERRENRK